MDLAPVLLGALLAWTGFSKLTSAPHGAPVRLFGRHARPVLVAVGVAELAVATLLLVRPLATVAGAAAIVLGAGFLGFLNWARSAAPGSGCGCTARSRAPVGPRAFARAWLVVGGGIGTLRADRPWWTAMVDSPGATVAVVAAGLAVVAVLFTERTWLPPVRETEPVRGTERETERLAA